MQEISTTDNQALANVQTLAEKVNAYGRKGLEGAVNTQRAYRADLKHLKDWCEKNNFTMMPISATTLAGYAAYLADTHKWSTINRRFAAIAKLHHLNNVDVPMQDRQFRAVMEGIKRTKGIRQKQAPAFNIKEIKNVLRSIETDTHTLLRNKAILLLGFTGAFRRSELVALNLEDLTFSEDGLIVSMGTSKTNQYGDYEEKAIFYSPETTLCPVRTLQNWMTTLGRTTGPLFVRIRKGNQLTYERLNDKTVNDLVKSYLGEKYSAHSLRASFITIAKLNGADDSEVMRQTKHRTSAMIIRYTRLENIKQHNAAMKLGL